MSNLSTRYPRRMASSFDDPEFRALLAKAGISHQRGMAADLLREVAPLLKADGVDLDDLDGTDIETLNAAMERAMERYNLSVLTPVGADRRRSLAILRVFTTAIATANGDDTRARAIIERVPSEADETSPSVSHVLGVSLGLIDDWYADDSIRTALQRVPMPAWHRKQSRSAASDLLSLARKGRAFDAIDSLIRRHRGRSALEGGALVVAASLIAVAESESGSLDEVAERMLGATSSSQPEDTDVPRARTVGSAFVKPAPQAPTMPSDLADRRLLQDFRRWLGASPELAGSIAEHVAQLEAISGAMRVLELDLNDPDDFDEIVDLLFEAADGDAADEVLFDQLDVLHLYVHSRLEGEDAIVWAEAHTSIEDAIDEAAPAVPNPFESALRDAGRIPVADRMAAYLKLPIISAVTGLMEWVGTSRPVTPAGLVRRADIAEVARLLGIDAVGVARVLDGIEVDGPRRVQSMSELPELRAWWEALQVSELIEVTATRVRPGAAAGSWRSGNEPPIDDVEKVIGMFLNAIVNPDIAAGRFEQVTAEDLLRELIIALSPETAEDFADEDLDVFLAAAAHGRMRALAALGIVTESADGDSFAVPEPLRGVVARALLTSMAVMEAMGDLDEGGRGVRALDD